jgi:hypothetical protein
MNPGAWRLRIDCDTDNSGTFISSLSTAKGGVGMAWISSIVVIVGVRLDSNFCDRAKELSKDHVSAGRRNLRKSTIDNSLFGRMICCILGGICGS